jgi:two-component system phosphate regulon sensor histidine kinase PhoR
MNKLRTARLLMTATIILIAAFQAYWMYRLFQEERSNFRKTADVVFRETLYRLQAERFTGDTLVFKGLPGDNIFMSDVISSVQKNRVQKDSGKPRLVISMNTSASVSTPEAEQYKRSLKKDTVIYVDTKVNGKTPEHIRDFLLRNKTINDSIPGSRVDSLYQVLLAKEGIDVDYKIEKTTAKIDTSVNRVQVKISSHQQGIKGAFITRDVPVGFMSPILYRAEFSNDSWYVLRKISLQIGLSVLLVLLAMASFIFIYRNLLTQKRLTEIKNEFIGNITHELKTPISTVSVAIEAMKNFNALQNPERTQEYLGIAGQELNRLSLLVDKVLRLSMFETQQVELKYEWFDLEELVEEVMRSMQLQFEKFRASVQFNRDGNNFSIMADRMHITSVVYNLLDNALKYSKNNPSVEVSLTEKEQALQLVIRDNGIGIPAAYVDKVFDKFFRVPHGDRHNVKGYGLGLSYVAHIIAEHKGTVTVQSEEGKGTTFNIILPKEHAGS